MTSAPTPAITAPFERRISARVLGLVVAGLAGVCALWIQALWPQTLWAQTDQSGDAEFFDRVDVDVVNLEVVVVDKKGNPVPGLTKDDFRLFEDGEEQKITNFYAAEDVRPIETVDSLDDLLEPEAPAYDELAGRPVEDAAADFVDPAQQLHLVVFVDHRNVRAGSRNRVLKSLREGLFDGLRPTDRVTLVGYDGTIDIQTLPTADRTQIEAGLERLMDRAPTGQLKSLDQASLLRQLDQSSGVDEMDFMLGSIRSYAQQQFDSLRAAVAELSQFVSVLSGLKGRKALVYVSDGMSVQPGEVLFRAYSQRSRGAGGPSIQVETESRQYNAAPLFEALGKQANAGRVTFYTILAGGPSSAIVTPAEAPVFVDLNDTISLGRSWDQGLETLELANRRGSMEILALTTGGRATTSTFAFGRAIEELRQDLRSYYSLGYATRPGDGEESREDHKLRVEVSNPDWKVRHRESYRRRSADEQMASVTRTALMLRSDDNPLGVLVQFGEPEKKKRKQWIVPVLVKFPLALVTLLPSEQNYRGQVSIYVATQEPGGDMSPVQKQPAPIQIPAAQMEAARGQVAGYRLALLMKEGEHRVAFTVRDELADVTSSFVATFDPAQPTDRR